MPNVMAAMIITSFLYWQNYAWDSTGYQHGP